MYYVTQIETVIIFRVNSDGIVSNFTVRPGAVTWISSSTYVMLSTSICSFVENYVNISGFRKYSNWLTEIVLGYLLRENIFVMRHVAEMIYLDDIIIVTRVVVDMGCTFIVIVP